MSESLAIHAIYSGRVQGVGFRYTVWQLAAHHRIVGWVRNLPDGRVEMWAEGLGRDLSDFLKAIADRFQKSISSVDLEYPRATGEFVQFEIRRH